jgi:hypothetical protein
MADIEISNIEILTGDERKIVDKLLKEYQFKIQRLTKTPIKLKVDVKEYDKDGKNRKYSINSQVIFSGKIFVSSSWDWDLTRAIRKAMIKIENEAEHHWKK